MSEDLSVKVGLSAEYTDTGAIKDAAKDIDGLKPVFERLGDSAETAGAAVSGASQRVAEYTGVAKEAVSGIKDVVTGSRGVVAEVGGLVDDIRVVAEGVQSVVSVAENIVSIATKVASLSELTLVSTVQIVASSLVAVNALLGIVDKIDLMVSRTAADIKQALGETIDFITAVEDVLQAGVDVTIETLGATLSAIGSTLWDTAGSGLNALSAAFANNSEAAATQAQKLATVREALSNQISEIAKLRTIMDSAAPGSEAYTAAGLRLAEIIPNLNLSLDEHGVLLAQLGTEYQANADKAAAYVESLKKQDQQKVIEQLAMATDAVAKNNAAIEWHSKVIEFAYGKDEQNRNGIQSLALAIGEWTGLIDSSNTKAVALAKTHEGLTAELKKFSEQALDSGLSIDQITNAMQTLGKTKSIITEIRTYLEQLSFEKAADSVQATADALGAAIAGIDTQLKDQQKGLTAAQAQEAATWKAAGEAAKSTYTAALAAANQYESARKAAAASTQMTEAQRTAALVAAEQTATAMRLAALQQYYTEALALVDQEAARKLAVAEQSDGDVAAVEAKSLTDKRALLSQIEGDYRAHIDKLIAEENRLSAAVKAIDAEIRAAKASGEDKVREMERQGLTDIQKYQDLRAQAADKTNAAIQAGLRGEWALSKQLFAQSQQLLERTMGAVKDGDRTVITGIEAKRTGLAAWLNDQNGLLKVMELEKQSLQEQAAAAKTSYQAMSEPLKAIEAQLTAIAAQEDAKIKVSLAMDEGAVDALVATIAPLVAAKKALLPVQADLATFAASLDDAEALAQQTPVELAVSVADAGTKLQSLSTLIADLGIGPEDQKAINLSTETAVAKVQVLRQTLEDALARPTESTHQVEVNDTAALSAIRTLEQPTESTHTVHIRTVQENALGGLIRAYAGGGTVDFAPPAWTTVPGTGNTDSVPAALPIGAFVLRQAAARYYGPLLDGIDALRFAAGGLVPSMLMPGERLFSPGTVSRLGAGFFDALNALAIPADSLASVVSTVTAPVTQFATGGLVTATAATGAPGVSRETVDITLRIGRQSIALTGARDQAAALVTALRDLQRTI